MACRALDAGHRVGLCELARFESNLEGFDKNLAIRSEGLISGRFELAFATTDPAESLGWADLILVVTHAAAHWEISAYCASFANQKPVILCPGYVGGGWAIDRQIRAGAAGAQPAVVECSVLPFACRKLSGDTVSIHGIKRRFMLSTIGPNDRTGAGVDFVKELFDGIEQSASPIEAGLNETNFILHPCVALLNMGYVQGGQPWTFYRQGLTPRIGALVEAIDGERQQLMRQLGLAPVPLTRWMSDFYADQGMRGDSLYEMIYTFPQFAKSPGPRSLDHRYFREDIAYGLVPMSSLAGRVGVEMPLTRSLIDLAGFLCNEDFYKTGRDLSDISPPASLETQRSQRK